jgi:hypothetical protein
MDLAFKGCGFTAITVDSGAQVSVCPYEWDNEVGTLDADRPLNMVVIGANG